MSRFFTSDHHFGHANILKYEDALSRKPDGGRFRDVEQMDAYLIKQWNAVVTPDDVVYCLGDFCYKMEASTEALKLLHGTKILIVGNHDPFFKLLHSQDTEKQAAARRFALEAGYSEIHTELVIEIDGVGMVQMSHFPYSTAIEVNQRYMELRPEPAGENLLLHGHVHSQWLYKQNLGKPPMINLGVEVWGMRPVAEETLVDIFQNRGIAS